MVASDGQLRVYRPKAGPGSRGGPVLACLRGTPIRMTLVGGAPPVHGGLPARGGSLGQLVTASPVVAYVVDSLTGVDTSASRLVVADVAHRAILREAPAGHSVDGGSCSPNA